jgi:succinylglutamic semialdehyde dehydrogenase
MSLNNIAMEGLNYLHGQWSAGQGAPSERCSPSDGKVTWRGRWASVDQVEQAVHSGCDAFESWSRQSLESRVELCLQFAKIVSAGKEELAGLISMETGKPLWESRTEVGTVVGKVNNSIDAIRQRRWTVSETSGEFRSVTRFQSYGTMLVLGPFNLPAHLPGAHIVPALLAGNTILFKPSELTPAVGQWLVQAWANAGLPVGVLNLVHGDSQVAIAAAANDAIAGILFTGSYRAGASLHRLLAGKPEKILALEMGGNNPLVVYNSHDYAAAAKTTILSAFITAGQRCTCARRLIVVGDQAYDAMVDQLCRSIPKIKVGHPGQEQQPFMGTLIHEQAASRMLEAQVQLKEAGARVLVEMKRDANCAAMLTPGLLAVDSDQFEDTEHFGPMLLIQRAKDLDHAIQLANRTRFGLAAGFLGDNEADYQYFLSRIRAGVVNWNRQTTGASGRLPFGGIGASGNHRPSGFFAADYCSFPVASLESSDLSESKKPVFGLELLD